MKHITLCLQSGLTPLHLAAQSGHEGLVRMLLNSQGVQADAATNVQVSIPHIKMQGVEGVVSQYALRIFRSLNSSCEIL